MKKKKQTPRKFDKNNKNCVINAKSNDYSRNYFTISRLVDVATEFATVGQNNDS